MILKQIAPNQTTLELNSGTILFFSYDTPVACYIIEEGFYRTTTKWSNTTTRHINKWLDGVKAKEASQEFFNNLIKE